MTAWPARDASIGQTGSTTRASTRRGWLAAGAFVGAYTALYAASYPLTNWVEREAIHGLPTDPGSLMYAALAIVGLALALNGRGELAGGDWLLGLAFGGVVWISIQSRYWYNEWTPYVPYLDPTMHAVATTAMVVGATVLLHETRSSASGWPRGVSAMEQLTCSVARSLGFLLRSSTCSSSLARGAAPVQPICPSPRSRRFGRRFSKRWLTGCSSSPSR
jgi:hypothetical protein